MRPPTRSRASSTSARAPASPNAAAAARPAAPAPMMMTSGVVTRAGLLVPERLNRVQHRRSTGRPEAEEQADRGAEPEGEHDGRRRDERVPLHELREPDRRPDTDENAEHAADEAERQRL